MVQTHRPPFPLKQGVGKQELAPGPTRRPCLLGPPFGSGVTHVIGITGRTAGMTYASGRAQLTGRKACKQKNNEDKLLIQQ
jgi:hypothetical protein